MSPGLVFFILKTKNTSNTKLTISYRNQVLVTSGKIGSWISIFFFKSSRPHPRSPIKSNGCSFNITDIFFFGYHTGEFKMNDDITKTGFV